MINKRKKKELTFENVVIKKILKPQFTGQVFPQQIHFQITENKTLIF